MQYQLFLQIGVFEWGQLNREHTIIACDFSNRFLQHTVLQYKKLQGAAIYNLLIPSTVVNSAQTLSHTFRKRYIRVYIDHFKVVTNEKLGEAGRWHPRPLLDIVFEFHKPFLTYGKVSENFYFGSTYVY